MEYDKIIEIATLVAGVMVIIILILRKRTDSLKDIGDDVESKMKAYIPFSLAYQKVCDNESPSAYKELHSAALDVALVADEDSKELLEQIISMTDKTTIRYLNKKELHTTCKACMESLNTGLYRKKSKNQKKK
jgi:hypothetical protein